MPFFDLSLDELRAYRPQIAEPADFDEFWTDTLKQARAFDLDAEFEPVDTGLSLVRTFDVTYRGYGGHPVKGWLTLPASAPDDRPLPAVVQYIGYGGGRGVPHQHLFWAAAGYAHFVMDTRGQGSGFVRGDTPDPEGSAPRVPGFMTQGVEDPATYYYRRVYTDAVRAVEAARSHPAVDETRIAVHGGSQGGGISIAVAGLVPDLSAALPDVPFLCHFERAVGLTDADPYGEIVRYLMIHRAKESRVRSTLSYFDGVAFARRATAPGLFSTALMDQVCPPSTVFAAYNAWAAADKDIKVYTFNGHEGGALDHNVEHLAWLRDHL